LLPVIFVAVLDFDLFKEKEYLTHHLITNAKTNKQSMYHTEFHFIELKKFTKTVDKSIEEAHYENFLEKQKVFLEQQKLERELEIARALLAEGLDPHTIARITQLSIEQINELRKK
jgi:hypothetical protein